MRCTEGDPTRSNMDRFWSESDVYYRDALLGPRIQIA